MKRCKHSTCSFFTALCTTFMVVLAVGFGINPALAVDGGPFQLDGNAQESDNPNGNPEDWDTPPKPAPGTATAYTGVIPDKNGLDNIFTGGGSKTPNLIEDWLWKTSPPPPDKNNITNAQAANYNVAGEQVIYFEADLFADNGDAELAFWFFQQEVAAVPPLATSGDFTGSHVDGDVYVAVKFANGGTQANIAVYEWWAACNKNDKTPNVALSCAADNIRIRVPSSAALCDGLGGKVACAITNTVNKPSPWPYTPKSGTPNIFPPTTFFEGGVNIFDIFGANKCFASFAATSGASTSFTATAKDFVLDEFDVCSADVTKTCVNDSEADDTPTSITYNVRGCGINDGGGDINITGLLNSIAGGAQSVPSDLAWYTPGQVDPGSGLRDFDPSTDCDDPALLKQAVDNGTSEGSDVSSIDLVGGDALVYQFSETTSMNGVSDEVTLDTEGTDGTNIDDATDTATCPIRTFNAALSVTKQCAANVVDVGSALEVEIAVNGTVCNEGEVELTGLTLTDTPVTAPPYAITPASTTLAPKGDTPNDCTTYTDTYTPVSIPSGDLCPFSDQVEAKATAPINSTGEDCTLNPDGITSECTALSNTPTCLLRAGDDDGDCSTGPINPSP